MLAAAAALALGGCNTICFEEPMACVAIRNATYPEYCHEIASQACLGDEEGTFPTPASCMGTAYGDTTCESLGFTEPCSGDYFVRPGTVC